MRLSIKGGEMLVDDDFVSPGKYIRVGKDGYAEVAIYLGQRDGHSAGTYVRIHRLVAGAAPNQVVDHINHDRLDNRRINLRLCSKMENSWHRKSVRGWTRHRCGRFQAAITVGGKLYHLGLFRTPSEASAAYQKANIAMRGEFAAKVNP